MGSVPERNHGSKGREVSWELGEENQEGACRGAIPLAPIDNDLDMSLKHGISATGKSYIDKAI